MDSRHDRVLREDDSAQVGAVVRHLPTSDHPLRLLHQRIEDLASHAASSYVRWAPLKVESNGVGEEYRLWHDDGFKVLTCDGGVYISADLGEQWWPDWKAITPADARRMANALLSAAADVSTNTANQDSP